MAANYFLTAEEQRASHSALLFVQKAAAERAARDPAKRARKWAEHFRRTGTFDAELVKVLEAAEANGYEWPYR